MFKKIQKSFAYGNHTVQLETGGIARQASGAVVVSMGDTRVLVTAVGKREAEPGRPFFPLTVNYQEKTYAAGKIPGGFFKREGRPSEKETLTSRLIDRPIRPLFPKGFNNDVQVIATVISVDPEVNADIPALIGASAALSISGMPFAGPIAAARVGYVNEEYVLNPNAAELENSKLDLIVAGTADAVLMVESEANRLPEDVMLGAVMHGHEQMQVAIKAINELAAEVGTPSWGWEAPAADPSLAEAVENMIGDKLGAAYQITEKTERYQKVGELRDSVMDALAGGDEPKYESDAVKSAFGKAESQFVRRQVLDGKPRIDGRDTSTVRPIDVQVGVLPRTHGSALFTRGETQAIVVTTLGTARDAQIIDALEGEYREPFMLHYNFPPYCVGETGFMSGPKRREIGHGKLAKRGISAVMPDMEAFP